jgi:chemotaxis protein MotB
MADDKKLQPIIVKKIKKGGHAAHGGAWKIAYADFVTAMMAFFLLMWLLGSTTEGDRKGLQDYFNAPLKVALSGGTGTGSSQSILPGGGKNLALDTGQTASGQMSDPIRKKMALDQVRAEIAKQDARKMASLSAKISAIIANSPKLSEFSSQIRLETTPDGLRIQIIDDQKRPMFDTGSAVVKPYMRDLLRSIGEVLAGVPNLLTLEGHTDATPFSGNGLGYSNWELSADRANASRRELIAGGLGENRILRVQGLASSQLFNPKDPHDPSNRRISIIVMNREAEDRVFKTAPEPDGAASDSPAEDTKASTPPPIDR